MRNKTLETVKRFVTPVLLWVLSYFVWSYSAQFINEQVTMQGLWWLVTDVSLGVVTFVAFIKAALEGQLEEH